MGAGTDSTMTNSLSLQEQNPEDLKNWLEQNRQNGFADLSPQHRSFCYEYLRTYNHHQAAEEVGVPKVMALRTLKNPLVQAFIAYLNQKKEHFTLIDAAFIEVQYLSLYSKLIGEEEVPLQDKNGDMFLAKKFHASESVSALRDMAKSTKFFKEGSGQGGVNINFDLGALGITSKGKDITARASVEIDEDVIDG